MKIDSGDKNNMNFSAVSSTAPIERVKNIDINVNKQGKSQQGIKPVSQMNDYDMGNMPVSERVVIEAIQRANKAISGGNRRFEFSIHEKTNEIVVKVFDSESNELIREIPNEKVLDMVARICEMAGVLVDERR